jgi:signal peptidase I
MQFKSPQSGYEWGVTPWHYTDPQNPFPIQQNVTVHDPMSLSDPDQVNSDWKLGPASVARSWGDRIFVLKYLYSIYDPARFDVVVFKNPRDPTINYIKRLIGLPDQMVALIDGDVFWRDTQPGDLDASGQPAKPDPWALPGWRVARKPERAQLAMWQEVFNSDYSPLRQVITSRRWFYSPWRVDAAAEKDWRIEDRRNYEYHGAGPTRLEWNSEKHPIVDSYSYNELWFTNGMPLRLPVGPYPVSDVRLSLGIRPENRGESLAVVVVSRGHEFRADIGGDTSGLVQLRMRPVDPSTGQGSGAWQELGHGTIDGVALPPGRVSNIDFWHADQSMKLFINGTLVAQGEYDWTPAERVLNSTGMTLDEVMASNTSLVESNGSSLRMPGKPDRPVYTRPKARFEFGGGPFTLYRVSLARDIYYQPNYYDKNDSPGNPPHSRAGLPALGTHPINTVILNKDEFFVCGDNSPQSLDARLWDVPNPWVAELDRKMGVVHRDLVIGKAFFVYFPAPRRRGSMPIPDFGAMRFIW